MDRMWPVMSLNEMSEESVCQCGAEGLSVTELHGDMRKGVVCANFIQLELDDLSTRLKGNNYQYHLYSVSMTIHNYFM